MSIRRMPFRVVVFGKTAELRPAAALLAAVLSAGAMLLPAAAHAHKCDRTDNDRREASRVIADLTGEIDAMERAIIEALRLQTGQLSGYIAQSAKAVTGALDSQTKLQAQTAREVAETGTMMAHRPSRSACEAVTGLRGLAATGAAAKGAHRRAAATETGRITGDRAVVDRPGAAAGDAARFESVTREYCNAQRSGEDRAGERCGGVLRQPHGLAHVPRRAPPPVADDGGGEACAVAAVAAVDVLDHFLPPLVLEVDVDVRRLAPLARDEALEQQVDLRRVTVAQMHEVLKARGIEIGERSLKAFLDKGDGPASPGFQFRW